MFREEWVAALQQWIGPGNAEPFRVLSLVGDTWGLLLAIGVTYWLYGRRPGLLAAVAAVLAVPVWLAMAEGFAVPRPSGGGVVVHDELDVGAFPSGHVFHAVSVWGVAAGVTPIPVWVPLFAGLLTGVGRLYLGAHYVADVVASLALAPLFAWGLVRSARAVDWRPRGVRPAVAWMAVLVPLVTLTLLLLGPLAPSRLQHWELVGIGYGAPVAGVLTGMMGMGAPVRRPGVALPVGILGLLALSFLARTAGPRAPVVAAAAAGLAMAWMLVVVPAVAGGEARSEGGGAGSDGG